MQDYDIIILGGGPAGLSAALVLGRACKRVLLCDGGTPRNTAAAHIQGFVTQDGTSPAEFRRIGRAQLAPYTGVTVRDVLATAIEVRGPDAFVVQLADGTVATARRILLAVGLVDELPPLPGVAALWGKSVHVCPFCHGWEVRGRRTGALVTMPMMLDFPLMLRGWSADIVLFTDGALVIEADRRAQLEQAGVTIEERPLKGLLGGDVLTGVELVDGTIVAIEALYLRPAQRQTALVASLGLTLDDFGYVKVDGMQRTSQPGILAAGDLTTMMQGALLSASFGAMAAYMITHELNVGHVVTR